MGVLDPVPGGGGNLTDAKSHFSAALRSGREKAYVRHLELEAFDNIHTPEYQVEIIEIVDEMRRNHEILDVSKRERILSEAYEFYGKEVMDRASLILSPRDQLETFLYLTEGIDINEKLNRKLVLAELTEKAGDIPKALSLY